VLGDAQKRSSPRPVFTAALPFPTACVFGVDRGSRESLRPRNSCPFRASQPDARPLIG
jgi:hypothetical protein